MSAERSPAARERARREEADRLDGEILEAIGRGWHDPLSESAFDAIARAIFAHQFRFNPVYRQFCLVRGVSAPADVIEWRQIPPAPAGAFKVGRWAAFPEEAEAAAFRTSGTTGLETGVHRFESLGLYNAAIVASAARHLFFDRERIRCLFLSPPPAAVPDSSLVHMFAVFREAFGAPGSAFLLAGGSAESALSTDRAVAAFDAAIEDGEPVLVAGPTLAFHLTLSALKGAWALPPGSRAMTTGGFKGLALTADPARLAVEIEHRMGIPRSHQVEEFGMTELSTQYYDDRLRGALGGEGLGAGFRIPPWARVRSVEAAGAGDVSTGADGALIHYDLANRGSAIAIQTSDVGAMIDGSGFALRGRERGAEARGCSLAAELWLERA